MVELTKSTKAVREKEIKREWHLIDAKDKVLGRIVPQIAKYLQGKHKVNYVTYLDAGDYVVVINAQKINVSGKKTKTKIYSRYSGYPGGLKRLTFSDLLIDKPTQIIKHAVSGMLPKNKFRSRRLARLFVFPNAVHPYEEKFKKENSLK